MTTTDTFVRKHNTGQLPIKYMRLSVYSLLRKKAAPRQLDELDKIGKQFARFIETPLTGKSED